jgi:hypothetical protein
VFDLQTRPEHPGLKWRRIDSKDPNFWSCRVSRDIRTIAFLADDPDGAPHAVAAE